MPFLIINEVILVLEDYLYICLSFSVNLLHHIMDTEKGNPFLSSQTKGMFVIKFKIKFKNLSLKRSSI